MEYRQSKPAKYKMKIFHICGGIVSVGCQLGEPQHKNLGLEVDQTLAVCFILVSISR